MLTTNLTVESEQHSEALAALAPERFGMQLFRKGWLREFPGVGQVAFASLAWPHAQVHSFDNTGDELESTNALGLIVRLQQHTWGFPPEEAVPVNILATAADTGGAVLIAYDFAKGFNSDGWLGFAIGLGTRSGVLYSHMLGVRQECRGGLDLGWYLKVLQGYLAVQSGHHAMSWTFDPLRGANARLNLEKLAARMINLTIDKYGVMKSSLYGDVPTDRFTAYWDLFDRRMHKRVALVSDGQYPQLRPADIAHLPEVTSRTVAKILESQPAQVRFEIPGDVDILMRVAPEKAVAWRQEMRAVLGRLMTTRSACIDTEILSEGPLAVSAHVGHGNYETTGFATESDQLGDRKSFYVLSRTEDLPT